ncbi:hypothetical protein CDD80_6871 [Ophiocordyceps camponoti-rufipedis]|uniref:Lariat debranching enzyme C-terminal domain-containing protein n=1 Tax=Ophiocordyceps camponoti-rufipedis TaxID=2004952 RepID=A0A2C5YNR6_9HYPO|nr:hypothetical protein CDD80_6871 [Ophiocordyceps camponoti-rufipedis]
MYFLLLFLALVVGVPPINHTDAFGPSFQQRYAAEHYTYQRKGPIFIQIVTGNAQEETGKSVITEYAHKMKGIAVGLEHRYFDGSHPMSGKEDAKHFTMDHLTLDNVLADAVNLVREIRTTIPGAGFSPVIAYGAGYSGFLALALRQNYPGIFLGAVAMAAPTRSLTLNPDPGDAEQFLYRDAVARLLIRRDPEAAQNIGKTFDFLEGQFRLARQDPMERLQTKLNLCTRPLFNDTSHLEALREFYANAIIEQTLTSYYQSESTISVPKMNEMANAASFEHYGENVLDIYGGFLQWVGKTWLRRHERMCVDWGNKSTTSPLENMFDPMSYVRCTYFPLCLANAKPGGLFPARTDGCLEMRQKCQDMFHGKAVQLHKDDILEQYKLSPAHLANSSRILFAVDRSDPMTALVGADPPSIARWNSCNVSRRVEFDFVGRIDAPGSYIGLTHADMQKWRTGEITVMQHWLNLCDKPELIFSSDARRKPLLLLSQTRLASMATSQPRVRVAIEGCGHGTLNAIYNATKQSAEARGWDGVDLVIICGDFQAARNVADLHTMSVPRKYLQMGDFADYYAGRREAPYLTIFIGGNHEASSYLSELHYGGWVAKNIYYMGAANVLRFGPLRIAGLSGIWKSHDYRTPHHERLPYNWEDVKSVYHVREIDVRKMLLLRTQVDVGLSHDWPRSIEKYGNTEELFAKKPDFRRESAEGKLGNLGAQYIMDRLRPYYWFSAHLHVKFAAIRRYDKGEGEPEEPILTDVTAIPKPVTKPREGNPDEIDLDMDDCEEGGVSLGDQATTVDKPADPVPQVLREQLPASFTKRPASSNPISAQQIPGKRVPPGITNKTVRFLSLDKCEPKRHYLQLCEIEAHQVPDTMTERPWRLEYDAEWLSICRYFHGNGQGSEPASEDLGEDTYQSHLKAERNWVDTNVVLRGGLAVPYNFETTAQPQGVEPVQLAAELNLVRPHEYINPQTTAFCQLLQLENFWHAEKEQRDEIQRQGPSTKMRRWWDLGPRPRIDPMTPNENTRLALLGANRAGGREPVHLVD